MTTPPDGRGRWKRTARHYPLPPDLPIDDALTQERLGYPATTISPGALKKVSCRCTRCRGVLDRMRRRVTPDLICPSCAHTKGDAPAAFPHETGNEKVAVVCVGCKRSFALRRKAVTDEPRCPRCRRHAYWESKGVPARAPNDYLLDATTLERFGYLASTVRAKSDQKVCVRCSRCSDTFERIRRNVTDKPVCKPCSCVTAAHNPGKRAATMLARYGTAGLPVPPNAYGKAEHVLRERLEPVLGRALTTQLPLPGGKSVDLYDPVSHVGVEYCGLHWHHETSKTPRGPTYHRDKMKLCSSQGIDLITIFEDEWLHRPGPVMNVLCARLGVHERRLFARQCELRPLGPPEANVFLEEHHLRGASHAPWAAWGLFADELVGVLTLGPHHRQGHEQVGVVDRLCFAGGVVVVGGAGRLIAAAAKEARERKQTALVSWSDNRWSRGAVYERLGFTLDANMPPDYTYVVAAQPRERLSKQSQMKSRTGCPADKTEHEWALERGLSRIWDCGRKRWKLTL